MKSLFLSLFAIACVGYAFDVFATVQYAREVVYFNESNQIIGESMIACNNTAEHAGDVTPTNPYRFEEQFGCGDLVNPVCHTGGSGITTCSYSNDYATEIIYFKSATGYTVQQYCNGGYDITTEFVGSPACKLPAPAEATSLGGWVAGFD